LFPFFHSPHGAHPLIASDTQHKTSNSKNQGQLQPTDGHLLSVSLGLVGGGAACSTAVGHTHTPSQPLFGNQVVGGWTGAGDPSIHLSQVSSKAPTRATHHQPQHLHHPSQILLFPSPMQLTHRTMICAANVTPQGPSLLPPAAP